MTTKNLIYEEWLNLPETKQGYETVDGVMPKPISTNWGHQRVRHRINVRLLGFEVDLREVFK